MSFSDRLRSWLKGETKRAAPSKSSDKPSRGSTKEMEEFVHSRIGVEAYLEPKTAIYSTTVLLVADDGEYLRRPVSDLAEARGFCERSNIPLYDAAKVGYPKRIRDYEQGKRPRRVDLSELPPWPGDDPDSLATPPDGPPPVPEDAGAGDTSTGGNLDGSGPTDTPEGSDPGNTPDRSDPGNTPEGSDLGDTPDRSDPGNPPGDERARREAHDDEPPADGPPPPPTSA